MRPSLAAADVASLGVLKKKERSHGRRGEKGLCFENYKQRRCDSWCFETKPVQSVAIRLSAATPTPAQFVSAINSGRRFFLKTLSAQWLKGKVCVAYLRSVKQTALIRSVALAIFSLGDCCVARVAERR